MEGFINAAIFLVQTLFTIYLVIFLIRILSPHLHGEFHNSIAQFIVKTTSPLIRPVRRFIPKHKPVDFAAIIVVFLVGLLYVYVYIALQTYYWMDFSSALLMNVGTLLHLLVSILFWGILIDTLLTWIASSNHHIHEPRVIIATVIQPVMRPLRRLIPPINGLDLTPFIALIVLKSIDIILVYRLLQLSLEQTFGS